MEAERRIGLEQEFFLVDEEGVPSDRADEFLSRCREMAAVEGLEPESFVGEVSRSLVEINNPPAWTVEDLAETYLASLDLALRAGRELGVRIYPLPQRRQVRRRPSAPGASYRDGGPRSGGLLRRHASRTGGVAEPL